MRSLLSPVRGSGIVVFFGRGVLIPLKSSLIVFSSSGPISSPRRKVPHTTPVNGDDGLHANGTPLDEEERSPETGGVSHREGSHQMLPGGGGNAGMAVKLHRRRVLQQSLSKYIFGMSRTKQRK